MKKFITICLGAICAFPTFSQQFNRVTHLTNVGYVTPSHAVVDANDNVIQGGKFKGSVDLDPGTAVVTAASNGFSDVFIQKFDAQGNLVFANHIGNTQPDELKGLAVDQAGNVYATLLYRNNLTINIAGTPVTFTTISNNRTGLLLKMNSSGDILWGKKIEDSVVGGDVRIEDVTVDLVGDIYVTGAYTYSLEYDVNGTSDTLVSNGGPGDVFFTKLDSTGNYLWAKSVGGSDWDIGRQIAIDQNNMVYLSGSFHDTVDFDPGYGVNEFIAVGDDDPFIQQYDPLGYMQWTRSSGSISSAYPNGLVCSENNEIYWGINFNNQIDLNPTGGFDYTVGSGFGNALIKLNNQGHYIWGESVRGFMFLSGLALDTNQNLVAVGKFSGTNIDFDPDTTKAFELNAGGGLGSYLFSLSPLGDFIWAGALQTGSQKIVEPGNVVVDNQNSIYLPGYFNGLTDFDPGIGQENITPNTGGYDGFLLKLNILPCQPSATSINVNACEAYTWGLNGISYNQTGTYSDTVITSLGCDSVVTLNLTINNTVIENTPITACREYTWDVNGTTYSTSTIDTALYSASSGCDSLVILDLTVNENDAEIVQNGVVLSAIQSGSTYQWIDCTTMQAISGATNKDFTPTQTGSYAAVVSSATCSDTSSCIDVNITSLDNQFESTHFSVYPNPASQQVTISTAKSLPFEVTITDLTGKIVLQKINIRASQTLDLSSIKCGTYIIQIRKDQHILHKKLIIE